MASELTVDASIAVALAAVVDVELDVPDVNADADVDVDVELFSVASADRIVCVSLALNWATLAIDRVLGPD